MPLLPEAQKNCIPACFYDNSPWLKVRGGVHLPLSNNGGRGSRISHAYKRQVLISENNCDYEKQGIIVMNTMTISRRK